MSNEYKRCSICDYCELSHSGRKRLFNIDRKTLDYLCDECTQSIGEALKEFSFDGEYINDNTKIGNSWRTDDTLQEVVLQERGLCSQEEDTVPGVSEEVGDLERDPSRSSGGE